jgi:hypothetical protein
LRSYAEAKCEIFQNSAGTEVFGQPSDFLGKSRFLGKAVIQRKIGLVYIVCIECLNLGFGSFIDKAPFQVRAAAFVATANICVVYPESPACRNHSKLLHSFVGARV